jgi:hypothetical protein
MTVGFANYRPVIRHLDVYPDEPRMSDVPKNNGDSRE